jgi:predicted phosphodiesterase
MRRTLIVALVVVATLAAGVVALATFRLDRDIDVGTVRMGIDVGRSGSLDLYVPLVDWGVRFPVVRAPARISVDVRAIDRDAITRLAAGGKLNVQTVRVQARDALASYLRLALLFSAGAALLFGALVALAVRGGRGPGLRTTLGAVVLTTLAGTAVLIVTLPPRSSFDRPEYYANGPEVPTALRALESIGASSQTLDEEIDDQLFGIARLVQSPAGREPLESLPRLTVASDLHNNVLALPALERAASGEPVLFAGDLTDRGTPLERRLVTRVVSVGTPFVFISGNHDSDVLQRKLARAGAIVLTRQGRLLPGGRHGALVVRVAGLRIAGYDDPLMRRAADKYRDNGAEYTPAMQEAFDRWLESVQDLVDVVMVHAPQLAELAVKRLRAEPPKHHLLIISGHTHKSDLQRAKRLTLLNPGSIGAGGTGNLAEGGGDVGLARLIYSATPRFNPLAADLIEIDPGNGSASAKRFRLDGPLTEHS